MAVTVTITNRKVSDNEVEVRGTILFDASYPTGGEAITIGTLGLSTLKEIFPYPSAGVVPVWNRSKTAPKILLYWVDTSTDGAAMAEVVDTTDLAAVVTALPFIAYGN
jgi:hypothetical protein